MRTHESERVRKNCSVTSLEHVDQTAAEEEEEDEELQKPNRE